MRRFNPADAALMRSARLIAEQLGVDGMLGERSAINDHKRFVASLGLGMQAACDQLFAGTAFATDQHRRINGCQFAQ